MPRYDYRCEKCGIIEILKGMNDVVDKCPKCGSGIERIFNSPPGLKFMGPGFFATRNLEKTENVLSGEKDENGVYVSDA